MATFISYSRANSDFAVRLASDLKSAGFNVWLDQLDIPTGARWDDEIEKALEKSTIFLIILSPESIESQNVKDEVGYAIDAGKYILPVLTKPCRIPLRLRRFQFVDFSNQPYEESLAEIKQLLSNTKKLAANNTTREGSANLRMAPAPLESNPLKNIPQADRAPAKKPALPKTSQMGYLALLFAGICVVAALGLVAVMFLSPGLQSLIQPPSSPPPPVVTTAAPADIAIILTSTPSETITPPVRPSETPTPTLQPDFCEQITNQSLQLNTANGFQGVIGPSGIALISKGNARYEFTTVAAFSNEQVDAVSGICENNTLTFTRTRPQVFIQDYQVIISKSSAGILSLDGSFINKSSGKSAAVSGQVTAPITPMGLCDQLAGKSLHLKHPEGWQGVIAPTGIVLIAKGDGSYSFSTVAAYVNEPSDPVSGNCQGNTLTFTRTRANAFIQDFQATISQNAGILALQGTITDRQSGGKGNWSAQVSDPHP